MHGQAPRDLADLVFREHTVAANELKRINELRVIITTFFLVETAPTPKGIIFILSRGPQRRFDDR